MIGRKRCPECFGTGESLDMQDRPAPCGLCVQAAADGILSRAFTVDARRLYAALGHPAGKARRGDV